MGKNQSIKYTDNKITGGVCFVLFWNHFSVQISDQFNGGMGGYIPAATHKHMLKQLMLGTTWV